MIPMVATGTKPAQSQTLRDPRSLGQWVDNVFHAYCDKGKPVRRTTAVGKGKGVLCFALVMFKTFLHSFGQGLNLLPQNAQLDLS